MSNEVIMQMREIISRGIGCHSECETDGGIGNYCGCLRDAQACYKLAHSQPELSEPALKSAQAYQEFERLKGLVVQARLHLSRDDATVTMSRETYVIASSDGACSVETNTTNFNLACSHGIQTALRQLVENKRRALSKEFFPE